MPINLCYASARYGSRFCKTIRCGTRSGSDGMLAFKAEGSYKSRSNLCYASARYGSRFCKTIRCRTRSGSDGMLAFKAEGSYKCRSTCVMHPLARARFCKINPVNGQPS